MPALHLVGWLAGISGVMLFLMFVAFSGGYTGEATG